MSLPRKSQYDAVVVGSGPNGFAAAITLQQAGLSVLLIEGKETTGGGMRTAELTKPGFLHDICSAVHPLGVASPFFSTLPLRDHGLDFVYPTFPAAHPFKDGSAVLLDTSLENTARLLGKDEAHYLKLMTPVAHQWDNLLKDILASLRYPGDPIAMARFGLKAIQPATMQAKKFSTPQGRAIWAGMAAHSMLPLDFAATSAIAMVLLGAAHVHGWPVAKGGSQNIARALESYFVSLGGEVCTGYYIESLAQLPEARAILFDVGPRQLLSIAGQKLSTLYRGQLQRYRYGMGVFKIDWALDGSIPFTSAECKLAGTVHLGSSFEDIVRSERQAWDGQHSQKPFVLLSQPSLFDSSRAPVDYHTAWGYCHVPQGSTNDMTEIVERHVETFAPGFRDRIIARHTFNSVEMENYNPNYIGGDINGGAAMLSQLFTRPALRFSPYRTSVKGLYLCSSSTPPGGGVHGMCGFHAARRALKDIFKIHIRY